MSKNNAEFKNRSRATSSKIYLRACRDCNKEVLMAKNQHFCSVECKGRYKYTSNSVTTETQYEKINGNWRKYCQRLLYYGGRRRDKLTWQIILNKLEQQNFKCALTGVELTCFLKKGTKIMTNASVDRIIPGGAYTEDNIQMVCRSVNSWRSDLTVQEFVDWCQKVVDYNK